MGKAPLAQQRNRVVDHQKIDLFPKTTSSCIYYFPGKSVERTSSLQSERNKTQIQIKRKKKKTSPKAVGCFLWLSVVSRSKYDFMGLCGDCSTLALIKTAISELSDSEATCVLKGKKMWSYKSLIGDQSPRIFLHVKHTKSLSLLSCHPSMLADKRSIIRRPKWGCLKSIWPEGTSLKTWPSF